ncbi:MAG: DNA-binding protein, partial [Enterococcus sp.]
MIVDFVVLTLLFGIGILTVNILITVMKKASPRKGLLILTIFELFVMAGFLYIALPSKNLSSLLWYNLWGAFTAILLASLYLSVIKAGKKIRKNTLNSTKRADISFDTKLVSAQLGKVFAAVMVLMVLLFAVSKISAITSIDEVYSSIPAKTKEKAEVLTSTKETPIAIAPDMAKRKMLQKFSVIPNSNMFTLDGITAQTINGEYVYVATVEYNGFFKWLKLGEVPGY